jgi:hypothetical protein
MSRGLALHATSPDLGGLGAIADGTKGLTPLGKGGSMKDPLFRKRSALIVSPLAIAGFEDLRVVERKDHCAPIHSLGHTLRNLQSFGLTFF